MSPWSRPTKGLVFTFGPCLFLTEPSLCWGDHERGGITLNWFEIYRSQVCQLQMGPAEEGFSCSASFMNKMEAHDDLKSKFKYKSERSFINEVWIDGVLEQLTLTLTGSCRLHLSLNLKRSLTVQQVWRMKSRSVFLHPPIICWVRPTWRAASWDPFFSVWLPLLLWC